jgi:hypothetical protein
MIFVRGHWQDYVENYFKLAKSIANLSQIKILWFIDLARKFVRGKQFTPPLLRRGGWGVR